MIRPEARRGGAAPALERLSPLRLEKGEGSFDGCVAAPPIMPPAQLEKGEGSFFICRSWFCCRCRGILLPPLMPPLSAELARRCRCPTSPFEGAGMREKASSASGRLGRASIDGGRAAWAEPSGR